MAEKYAIVAPITVGFRRYGINGLCSDTTVWADLFSSM